MGQCIISTPEANFNIDEENRVTNGVFVSESHSRQFFRNFQPPGNRLRSELFPWFHLTFQTSEQTLLIVTSKKSHQVAGVFHLWVNFDGMSFYGILRTSRPCRRN